MCAQKEFPLPKRCRECKNELVEFIKAFKFVRARVRYPVAMTFHTVSFLGFKTGVKVGAIRGKRDNNLVAEIALERNGMSGLRSITKFNEEY
jgi:hypothetical protein